MYILNDYYIFIVKLDKIVTLVKDICETAFFLKIFQ